MDEPCALACLPETYELALRLRQQGLEGSAIVQQLGLEPEAIAPLFRLAGSKLAALGVQPNESVSAKR